MTLLKLKHIADFRADALRSPRPMIALEHLQGWTGATLEGAELGQADEEQAGVAAVEPGDVLFGKLRPYLAKTFTVDRPMAASTELICMRPTATTGGRWLGYVSRSTGFIDWSVATSEGTKMPRTSWEKLREFPLSRPGLEEQRAIADYLDTETARIDALITKKQHMSKAVAQRFQAQVDEACVGEEIVLRRLIDRFVDYRGATPEKTESGVPLITATHVKGGVVDHSLEPVFVSDETYESWMRRGFPSGGDVLLTMEAPLGEVAQITDERVALAQRLMLFKTLDARCSADYLAYAFRSSLMQDRLRAHSTGSTASGIKADRLKGLSVPWTSREEQDQVVKRLRHAEAWKRRVTDSLARQMDLLHERRRALVTAAVTGEFRVPGAG